MIVFGSAPAGAGEMDRRPRRLPGTRLALSGVRRAGLVALLVLAVAAGCSRTRIAYNFSDWYLLHRIDHYFDLNATQKRFLEARIRVLKAWHRQHELPRWVEALQELERRYTDGDGLSLDDADWAESRYTELWRRLLDRGLPDFTRFLTMVDARQIRHLQDRLDDGDDWLTRQAGLNRTDLLQKHRRWVEGVFEDWYGYLTAAQRGQIHGWVQADPVWMQERLKNQRKFQRDFVALMQRGLPADEIQTQLATWLHDPATRWEPGFHERLEARSREWKALIVRVDALMTPDQRRNALDRIRGYRRDFQALAGLGPGQTG